MRIDQVVNAAVGYKELSINTFSGNGIQTFYGVPIHHVTPHYVSGYFRDGKYIKGFWRDGDGNTSIMSYRGYYARNPRRK